MPARNKHLVALLILTSLCCLTPTSSDAAEWRGSVKVVDNIPHVMNPADPVASLEMLKPQQLWHIGDDESDDEQLLGFVTDVKVDAQGNCYLLDGTLCQIGIYSSTGEFIRTIGGQGEGPTEFQNASQFILMSNGYLGVLQAFPAKVVTLDGDGLPGPHFSVCGNARGLSTLERGQAAGEHVVIGSGCANFDAVGVDYSLAFVDSQGEVLHTIRSETELSTNGSINIGGAHDFEFIEYWTLAANGNVYISPEKDNYRIDVYDTQGDLVRVIQRRYETLRRSAEARAADKKQAEEMKAKFGNMVQMITREYERDIETLHARPNGELWVASSRSLRDRPDNTVGLFDVFNERGHFLRQVGLEVDYDAEYDDYVLIGDLLFILKQANAQPATTSTNVSGGMTTITFSGGVATAVEDEETGEEIPPSVICYRLPQ
ncbi:MAG: 6-bladed beta-propeller [bacterium]|nr:6-bladed beta-propeller [bacterium]